MINEYYITASLVLYDTSLEDLENVLNSVFHSRIDRLYVIDNSPTDDLSEIILKYNTDRFEYFQGHGNIGFGRANNMGIERAVRLGSKYHIVLNPDITFSSGVIAELAHFMDMNDRVGQVLPRVEYSDGELQYLCKLLPTPLNILLRSLLPSKYYKKQDELYEMRFMGYDVIYNCPLLSGCFMFLRMDTLKDVGLFDPRFFMYFEDFDLMRRIHQKYLTVFYPYATIKHNHFAGHRKELRLLKDGFVGAVKYFSKWGWFFDSQRKAINKRAVDGVKYQYKPLES